MGTSPPLFFIGFAIQNSARFEALGAAFEAIKRDKDSGDWRPEDEWLALFDDEALAQFNWPTREVREAHLSTYRDGPIREVWTNLNLEPPSWEFLLMIEDLMDAEYVLIACRMVDEHRGQIEFDSQSFPYGETGSLQIVVRAFGFEVTDVVDGYPPRSST
jgi:hypothetical protein